MNPVNPAACALFLLAAFVLAGAAQTVWFRSRRSRAFAQPIDFGATLRGRRLFGDNKTLRGFVVMVPAAALAFPAIALGMGRGDAAAAGLWPLTAAEYAWLGGVAGLAFMLGELPNSFVKRQLDIAPGSAAPGSRAAACQFLVDRLDSPLAMLLAVATVVPVPVATWVVALSIGPLFHWSFSVLMFRLGVKARPA